MSMPFTLKQMVVPVVTASRKSVLFPVRRIYCIGQNYESHAREMGGHASKNNPFFFTKPTDALVTVTSEAAAKGLENANAELEIRYPPMTESYHYEVELVIAVGPTFAEGEEASSGEPLPEERLSHFDVPVEKASALIYAYGVGLDMTRRDMQAQAKENGRPWDLAKGADDCAVVSPLVLVRDLLETHPHLFTTADSLECVPCAVDTLSAVAVDDVTHAGTGDVKNGAIYLSVNGNAHQHGDMGCMINAPAEIIAMLSKLVTLHAGDLIFTGTPAGVGPVRRGDVMLAGIEGIGEITVKVI